MSAAGQATKLVNDGYKNTKIMIGGYAAWKKAGFPLVRASRQSNVGASLLGLVDRLTTKQWLFTWVAMVLLCGVGYWALSGSALGGLISGNAIEQSWGGLLTSLYFSVVTATSLGYGDVVPLGVSRFIAVAEAAAGMFVFGAIIAKLLSRKQEQLIEKIYKLTFEERLGRIQRVLHLSIAEFHSTSETCLRDLLSGDRIRSRFESAAMIFERELRAVRNLLYEPEKDIDETVLEFDSCHTQCGASRLCRSPSTGGEGKF